MDGSCFNSWCRRQHAVQQVAAILKIIVKQIPLHTFSVEFRPPFWSSTDIVLLSRNLGDRRKLNDRMQLYPCALHRSLANRSVLASAVRLLGRTRGAQKACSPDI
jgi:hypothetical protein